MAILDAVFANKQGQTPQDIERRRRMAQALIAQSQENERITSPWQGVAKIAQGLIGGYEEAAADKKDREGQARGSQAILDSLYGPTPSAAPSQSSIPMPGAAGEVTATSPKYDGAPVTAKGEVADYIRQSAAARGIDPDIALKVALSEGGVDDPVRQSLVMKNGVREQSYGPYQLYMGGGLGNKALAAGIDPRDPNQWKKGVDFALDQAKAGGWGPWYGAKKIGVTGMMGIGNAPAPQQPAQVASLDPAAGMPMPGATGQMRAADPAQAMAPTGRQPMQGPTQTAPALPPPTTVANPPPVAAQPPQQVAQALMAPPQPTAPVGVPREQIAKLLSDPYTAEAGQMLLMQEVKRRQDMQAAQYEQQLKMSDPKYQQDLQKGQIELQNLREPKMSPSEQATDAREREKMAFERQKFDEEVKKGQWQKLTDGRLYNQTTGDFRDAPPPVPGSVTPKFDDISGMRKEIQQLPSYKNLAAAAPIYKAMAETAGRNTKASDLNLVYGLGKIMDPTSVVREGEMIMVKNTASLPDWLQGAIASLNGGAALTPETRQAIMTEAYGRVKGYNDEFQQNMGQYQGIVQRNGINPSDVIPDVDKFEPWTAAPAGAPTPQAPSDAGPVPEGIPSDVWGEMTPAERKLWQK